MEEKMTAYLRRDNKNVFLVLVEYLLAFFIVLDCNSVYANLVNSPYNLQKMSLGLSVALIGIICWNNRLDWRKIIGLGWYPAILVAAWAIILLFFITISEGFFGSYVKYFVLFLPVSIILFKLYRYLAMDYRLFFRVSDILVILSLMSLVIWFLSAVLGVIHPNKVIQSLWGPMKEINSFWGLQFLRPEQQEVIGFLNILLYRNIGLYPESPMFDIVLLLAFFTELFLGENRKKGRIILFFITIVSTFGTLAIILAVTGVFLKAYMKFRDDPRFKYFSYLMILCLFIVVAALFYYKKRYGMGSYSTHWDDLVACFKAWKTSPIFGTGFENNNIIQSFMSEFRKWNRGYTTSAGAVLAHGGFTLMGVYVVPFIQILKINNIKANMNEALFGLLLFIVFITFIFTYRFLMLWLLAFGYSKMKWCQREL